MDTIFSRLPRRAAGTILLIGLALAGCGPSTVTSLRRAPTTERSFEVPADYETVYHRLAVRVRRRYSYTNLATYQPAVTATLAPASQSGVVTVWDAGGIGLQCLLHADLHALDADRTEVRVTGSKVAHKAETLLWERWANTPLDTAPADPNE